MREDGTAARVQRALQTSGWDPEIAEPALDRAIAHVGRDAPFDELLHAALLECTMTSLASTEHRPMS